MRLVNMHDAKTHLSQLVRDISPSQEILIAIAGKPVARLCSLEVPAKRRFGVLKGKMKIAADFDDPLPDVILDQFES